MPALQLLPYVMSLSLISFLILKSFFAKLLSYKVSIRVNHLVFYYFVFGNMSVIIIICLICCP